MSLTPKNDSMNFTISDRKHIINILLKRRKIRTNGRWKCWEYTGYIDESGYGILGFKKKNFRVHRISWIGWNENIPRKTLVLHKCDNRKCFNPKHLFLGNQKINMSDCVKKGRFISGRLPGEMNPMSKLTPDLVKKMRAMRPMFYNKIAKRFGISTMTAFRAINRISWKEV